MSTFSKSAILPLELEHRIFYEAAYSAPSEALNLMLVAWRIKQWVEPLFYRSLVVGSWFRSSSQATIPRLRSDPATAGWQILHSKPTEFLSKAVENLMVVDVKEPAFRQISPLLKGARNLVVVSGEPVHGALDAFQRLQRLDCNYFKHLFDCDSQTNIRIAENPTLAWLTHLELGDESALENFTVWSEILRLPSLTHLAIAHWKQVVSALATPQRAALIAAMHPTGRLNAFVVRYHVSSPQAEDNKEFDEWLESNPGFVALSTVSNWASSWWNAVLGLQPDFWTRVDEHVRRRRCDKTIGRILMDLEPSSRKRNHFSFVDAYNCTSLHSICIRSPNTEKRESVADLEKNESVTMTRTGPSFFVKCVVDEYGRCRSSAAATWRPALHSSRPRRLSRLARRRTFCTESVPDESHGCIHNVRQELLGRDTIATCTKESPSMPQDSPLATFHVGGKETRPFVTVDQLKDHLALLHAFADLRARVEDTSAEDLGIEYFPPESEKERRWSVFVGFAVERFERWCLALTAKETESGIAAILPPLDVLMVWHTYLLNPGWYAEDCLRIKALHGLWDAGKALSASLGNGLASLVRANATGAALQDNVLSWVRLTDTPFDPFEAIESMSAAGKTVECVKCGTPNTTPYLTADGTGYLQLRFVRICTKPTNDCFHHITHADLAMAKLAKDLALPNTNHPDSVLAYVSPFSLDPLC
uniref:Uncharacterized protein n=1 Tax=Mycena chlorophos TaxID=658473 RepID=A0ABQ0L3K3_MYCCL|nr:predicted protein [Mycena chlorophos]